MNAREAMQAMIDGKTVRASNGTLMKLSKDGEELTRYIEHGRWHKASIMNEIVEVIDEYPLTSDYALRAMLDGKTIENHEGQMFCLDSLEGIVWWNAHEMRWEPCLTIPPFKKWKVIE